jgi:hypothetical protein
MLLWIQQLKKNKKTITLLLSGAMVFFIFFYAHPALAQQQGDVFGITGIDSTVNLGQKTLPQIVVGFINIFLGLLGIIALCIVLYGGFIYMTSGGNEEKITQAKKILTNGLIGLVIIMSSWAITKFILAKLGEATGVGGFGNGSRGNGSEDFDSFAGSGAAGRTIKYQYPARDQKDVPRNTRIVVTFFSPMNPASIIENSNNTCWGVDGKPTNNCQPVAGGQPGEVQNPYYGDCFTPPGQEFNWETNCDKVKTSAISIFPTSTFNAFNPRTMVKKPTAPAELPAYAMTTYQDGAERNAYTFVFKPVEYLGNDDYKMDYSVGVISTEVKTKNNEKLLNKNYAWTFQTDTTFDFTPPKIVSRNPKIDEVVPRNQIVQVQFSKEMDPLSISGQVTENDYAENLLFGNQAIQGEWRGLGNVTEFVPSLPCGQNSCGEVMYCLPVNCADPNDTQCTNIAEILLRTAQTFTNNSFEARPSTGITDIFGNALDGDSDDVVDGKPQKPGDPRTIGTPPNSADERIADNSYWSFVISNNIDRVAPLIEKVDPKVDEEGVVSDAPLKISFSKAMWYEKLRMIGLDEHPLDARMDEIWYFVHGEKTTTDGFKDSAVLTHRQFGPNGLDFFYFPSIPSTVRDLRQNCLYPGTGPYSVLKGQDTLCHLDNNGDPQDCTPTTFAPDTDTGCAQTSNEASNVQPNIKECLKKMRELSQGGGLPAAAVEVPVDQPAAVDGEEPAAPAADQPAN